MEKLENWGLERVKKLIRGILGVVQDVSRGPERRLHGNDKRAYRHRLQNRRRLGGYPETGFWETEPANLGKLSQKRIRERASAP
jgi:hypothetical protein